MSCNQVIKLAFRCARSQRSEDIRAGGGHIYWYNNRFLSG